MPFGGVPSQPPTGDIFKGFNTKKQAELGRIEKQFRNGNFDGTLNRVGD